jgi:hypothetical protein
MWKRLLLIMALAGAVAPAQATLYTDIWWDPAQSGWGVNFVQTDDFIFATTYIYDVDNTPTFITANLYLASNGNYVGDVIVTTGPYFAAAAYDTGLVTRQVAGTATFRPDGPATGNFSYRVFDKFVSKDIQRQNLVASALDGSYVGALRMDVSGCLAAERNALTYRYAEIEVVETAPGRLQIAVPIDSGLLCTFAGPLTQTGNINHMTDAAYVCNDVRSVTATLSELKSTSLGIEGRWLASIEGGCQEYVTFSGVRR